MRQQLRIMSLALLCCPCLAVTVLAQNNPQKPSPRRAAAYSAPHCGDGRALVACLDERSAPAKKRGAARESPGAISRFAKLAGMFTGRVDAADVGNFKFRFKLELANAHDFARE